MLVRCAQTQISWQYVAYLLTQDGDLSCDEHAGDNAFLCLCRVEIVSLSSQTGASHHEYGMLLKDERFWLACDGEMVLVFQVQQDTARARTCKREESARERKDELH